MNWRGKNRYPAKCLSTAALGLLAFAAALPAAQQPGQNQAPPAQQQPQPPAPPEPSQPPTSQAKITTESKLVTVYATVRDKKGTIVNNLSKDDFVLEEDGRAQAITNFARESDLPLTMGLLVDTSMSQRRVLEQERHASYTFLDHMLRETGDKKDRAFIIHFDHEVELLQDLTSSRRKLEAALEALETPRPQLASQSSGGSGGGSSGSGHGGGGHHSSGGGTLLYDAVFLGADEVLKKEQGRKALIVLSDGVDRGSQESLDGAVRAAQRANTIVYSILFKDEESHDSHGGYGGGYGGRGGGMGGHRGGQQRYPQEDRPDGKKVLERISKETGGRMFVVSKKQSVDDIYSEIEQELRHQYILGYPPEKTAAAGYHKIHLATKQKDLTVQSRDGYYSEP